MAQSKYFPNLENGVDNANVEQVEQAFSDIETDVNNILNTKQDTLTFDDTPTAGSLNPVTSGGIKTYVDNKIAEGGGGSTITVDSALSDTSTNPVQNKVIKNALDTKQDTLTFDDTPTADSTNPVTSGGVKTALDDKLDKTDAVGQKTAGGGEIFNDYTNNKAAVYSHAEGFETVAGQMGHLITDDGWGNSTSKTYTLTSVDGLAVNDTISMLPTGSITNNVADITSYDIINDFAKITAIDITAKTITVDTYQSRQSNYGVIYVTSKPAVGTIAVAEYSHSEGGETKASGTYSHAEGNATTSSGIYSHAEGGGTNASARGAHAEGGGTTASGIYSHSEGSGTKTSSYCAHAEGQNTTANGDNSHTEGIGTKTYYPNQHVQGKYNTDDPGGNYAHIVGNGTSDTSRSNAHTLDWNGNAWFAGNVRVGGTYTNGAGIVGAKTLATIDDVRPNIRLIIEDTVIVNTIYDLALRTELNITLPSGQLGDFIEFDFISGETATNLTVNSSSGLVGFDLIPGANTIYTLYFDWGVAGYDGTSITHGWRCNYSEYSITV